MCPVATFDGLASKLTVSLTLGRDGENTKSALGAVGNPIVTTFVVDADPPVLLVTVKVTGNVWALPNVCDATTPLPVSQVTFLGAVYRRERSNRF